MKRIKLPRRKRCKTCPVCLAPKSSRPVHCTTTKRVYRDWDYPPPFPTHRRYTHTSICFDLIFFLLICHPIFILFNDSLLFFVYANVITVLAAWSSTWTLSRVSFFCFCCCLQIKRKCRFFVFLLLTMILIFVN